MIDLDHGLIQWTFNVPHIVDRSFDMAGLEVTAKLGDFVRHESDNIQVVGGFSGKVQTDKPIYQPGQTVHARALIFDIENHAVPNKEFSLRVEGDGDLVHTANLKSSRFGVIQDDWAIPASATLGRYSIIIQTAEHDQIAREDFRVNRYDLPTFNVTVTPDRSTYLPGQPVSVKVQGNYLFGKPVPGGKIKITKAPRYVWNNRTGKNDSENDRVAEGQADQSGSFDAHLDLQEDYDFLDNRWTPFRDVGFSAFYTDPTSGRTEQKKFDIRITREPIHVYISTRKSGGSLPASIYVSTFYADGHPAETTVSLEALGQTDIIRTNRYGVGKAALVLGGGSRENIEARAVDSSGLIGTATAEPLFIGTLSHREH